MKTFAVLVLVLLIPAVCLAQDTEAESPEETYATENSLDVYVFPIPYGSSEWKALHGYRARIEACRIPEEVLKSMSTDGLVQTCLNYPLRGYWMFSSMNIFAGIRGVIYSFNGLTELMDRPDGGTALLRAYSRMDPETRLPTHPRDQWTLEDANRKLIDFAYIEFLLCQEPILSGMRAAEKRELIEVCMRRRAARAKFGFVEVNTILLGRTLLNLRYGPFAAEWADSHALQEFLEIASRLEPLEEMTERILRHAEFYLVETEMEGGTEL